MGCELTQFVNEEMEDIQNLNSSLCAKKKLLRPVFGFQILYMTYWIKSSFNKVLKKNKHKIVETIKQIKNASYWTRNSLFL